MQLKEMKSFDDYPSASPVLPFEVSDSAVIMDFTGAYRFQPFACGEGFEWLDCKAIDGTDCYCDKEGKAALRKLIAAFSPYGLHFIDSGNYHYMTKLWTDRIKEPFSLVLFDHHADMQPPMFEGLMSCGGWVKDMLDCNPFLQKVLIVGIPEEEAVKVRSGRVYVIPEETCAAASSYTVGTPYTGSWQKNDMEDSGFCPGSICAISGDIIADCQLPDFPIYISVDKDVLSKEYALTNWDQGNLTLDFLVDAIACLMSRYRVIGMDVCGEPDASGGFHACNSNLNNTVNARLAELWKSNSPHLHL